MALQHVNDKQVCLAAALWPTQALLLLLLLLLLPQEGVSVGCQP
jgi:hypothetical protein